jgi:hypothetical protein
LSDLLFYLVPSNLTSEAKLSAYKVEKLVFPKQDRSIFQALEPFEDEKFQKEK